ncbi:MAG: NAD-dependent deacylase [candidate division KSB1 bacterium]|nr:NAD-dependent deacylase [candidate division KSB1 bacterium]MDZ7294393.1 NAD-dependent deacylase [candidate division KSB1 bacterium]MDZ7337354.1 NAD-dependent deacylase [candidate division KSB1 bacterium]MDZ7386362.1 NAD-dependent deacylase [candidate division KSB1 bacterium]MDZ7393997.1 NAD-dependent deacylase [candidate division KSB1 bacterium]
MEAEPLFSEELVRRLRQARSVAVLTGAGVSAESGVPTFRGADGLWKKFRPEELATFDAFQRNPALVWEWYEYRRSIIRDISPNPGHYALAELEKMVPDFSLITQNVDGLHRRAGSRNVLELHGNIMRNRCSHCGALLEEVPVSPESGLPHCSCGGLLRPDVVWFGEMLPERTWEEAVAAAHRAEVFFSIGTSAVVYPAASLPLEAKSSGAYVVEINFEPTPLTTVVHESIRGKSGEILPLLLAQLRKV